MSKNVRVLSGTGTSGIEQVIIYANVTGPTGTIEQCTQLSGFTGPTGTFKNVQNANADGPTGTLKKICISGYTSPA
jgi:hypothetical protein